MPLDLGRMLERRGHWGKQPLLSFLSPPSSHPPAHLHARVLHLCLCEGLTFIEHLLHTDPLHEVSLVSLNGLIPSFQLGGLEVCKSPGSFWPTISPQGTSGGERQNCPQSRQLCTGGCPGHNPDAMSSVPSGVPSIHWPGRGFRRLGPLDCTQQVPHGSFVCL